MSAEITTRIGIMGGTFDPIHFGHLFIAEEARARYNLNKVLFIPNGTPPHKPGRRMTAPEHRYEMCRIAISDNNAFVSDEIEMHRPGLSYTVDTLRELSAKHPGADLFYILGIDAAAELMTWKAPAEVMSLTHFIVAARPGYTAELLAERLPESFLEKIQYVSSTGLDMSSTDIRTRLATGLPVRYLVPDAVIEYIQRNNLYAPGGD